MKTSQPNHHLVVLALVLAALVPAGRTSAQTPIMRDAATHQQLADQQAKAPLPDPMNELEPCNGPDPSVANAPKDLLSQSEVLCHGGVGTLVPKGALLTVPAKFKARTKMTAGARIVTWAEFLAQNRTWLTAVEVTIDEAAGRELLPQNTQRQMADCGNVVVATYLGGPISVLEFKPGQRVAATRR
jgi:hypothetical protein